MRKERLLFLILGLGFLCSSCGRIWGSVTWSNQNPSSVFAYTCSTQVFLIGNTNNANGPSTSLSGTAYSISPTLPAGLSFNTSNGVISGTPVGITAISPYTVTATGPFGTSNLTVNIGTDNGYVATDPTDSAFVGPGTNCISALGTCNLRSAIQATINSGSSKSIVVSPTPETLTVGSLNVTGPMNIYGDCAQGTVINGLVAGGRIFNLTNSGAASFSNLTLQNATLTSAGPGAGMRIRNTGVATFTITVSNTTFQNNLITGSAASDNGAAIDIEGNSAAQETILNISKTTFYNNQNTDLVGAGIIMAGLLGTSNTTQTTIDQSSFISNYGTLVWFWGGAFTVTNSLFYNNTAGANGGAILIYENGSAGPTTWSNDTFDANVASGGNTAGILLYGGPGGSSNFTNCTFANNSGVSAGIFKGVVSGNLANNLFYNNVVSNCSGTTMTSLGGNLTDSTAADCNLVQASDIVLTNAKLSSLQSNGGLTETMALLATSPAIDAAIIGNCPPADQRGDARHIPTSCDIGAYEHEP